MVIYDWILDLSSHRYFIPKEMKNLKMDDNTDVDVDLKWQIVYNAFARVYFSPENISLTPLIKNPQNTIASAGITT